MIRQFLFAMLIASVLSAQVSQLDRAWQLAGNGQRREAVELLRQLIKSAPRNADARLLLGSLLVEQGEKAESIDQLREAVRLRPGSAEPENALGEAYKRFGEMGEAR